MKANTGNNVAAASDKVTTKESATRPKKPYKLLTDATMADNSAQDLPETSQIEILDAKLYEYITSQLRLNNKANGKDGAHKCALESITARFTALHPIINKRIKLIQVIKDEKKQQSQHISQQDERGRSTRKNSQQPQRRLQSDSPPSFHRAPTPYSVNAIYVTPKTSMTSKKAKMVTFNTAKTAVKVISNSFDMNHVTGTETGYQRSNFTKKDQILRSNFMKKDPVTNNNLNIRPVVIIDKAKMKTTQHGDHESKSRHVDQHFDLVEADRIDYAMKHGGFKKIANANRFKVNAMDASTSKMAKMKTATNSAESSRTF